MTAYQFVRSFLSSIFLMRRCMCCSCTTYNPPLPSFLFFLPYTHRHTQFLWLYLSFLVYFRLIHSHKYHIQTVHEKVLCVCFCVCVWKLLHIGLMCLHSYIRKCKSMSRPRIFVKCWHKNQTGHIKRQHRLWIVIFRLLARGWSTQCQLCLGVYLLNVRAALLPLPVERRIWNSGIEYLTEHTWLIFRAVL